MPLPTILVNSASGSDAAASGAGPATALSGTGNAATDGAGTTVTLPAGTDLSGVATDGSHAIFLNDATAGNRNFGKITGSAGSGGATPTVTVANAFGLSLTNKDWAIGGKRASVGSTTSAKLFSNNGAAGDAMPGWAVEMESGHAETLAASYTLRRSGDQTDGPVVLRGTSGAATMPRLTFSNNGTAVTLASGVNYVQLLDFELRNTNATKTASVAVNATAGTVTGVVVRGLKVADAAAKFWRGLSFGNFACTFDIRRNEIGYAADSGLVMSQATANTNVRSNRIHDCGSHGIALSGGGGNSGGRIVGNEIFANTGDGINRDTSTASNGVWVVEGNTCYANGSDGIDWGSPAATVLSYANVQIVNNILANNGAYGLNLSGVAMTANAWNSAGTLAAGNQTFGNTSGPCNLAGVLTGDTGLDPQFTSSTDLRIGANLRGQGYPADSNPGTGYRTYVNPGANQPQQAGGGPPVPLVAPGWAYLEG